MPPITTNPGGLAAKFANRPAPTFLPHIIVKAGAGTGKTTTMIEGLNELLGFPTKIQPSGEQRDIWMQIAKSRNQKRSIGFCSFSNTIVDELKERVPPKVDAKTVHGMGLGAINRAFSPKPELKKNKSKLILAKMMGVTLEEAEKTSPQLMNATAYLVGLCKQNMKSGTPEELDELADHHDVQFGTDNQEDMHAQMTAELIRQAVYDFVPKVLEKSKDLKDGMIDHNDMVWLPVVLNLNVWKYDLLFVDEFQDTNRAQQELVKRCGKRLVLIGDERQAIFGFAGADAVSMKRLEVDLRQCRRCKERKSLEQRVIDPMLKKMIETAGFPKPVTDPKVEWPDCSCGQNWCTVLELTVSQRNAKAIVREANKYSPNFKARPDAPEGIVGQMAYPIMKTKDGAKRLDFKASYAANLRPGDMVVCRANAPLINQYFFLLKNGVKSSILGRGDVGEQLASLISQQKAKDIPELIQRIGDWKDHEIAKENAKKEPSEHKVMNIEDRHDCVIAFTEEVSTIKEMLNKINTIFTDNKKSPGVKLGSIHKVKGLEADRVFYLIPGGFKPRFRRMQDWQWEQELNLRYVAITRAKTELYYVV